jgi:MFS family permease
VARKRLATDFGIGLVLWGAPLVLVGAWPHAALALILLGIVGVGNTLVDITGMTLMQRAVSDEVLARVFGALESLLVASLALGAVIAPIAIELIGIRAALIAIGAVLPVVAALAWRRLTRLDRVAAAPEDRVRLLSANPIFAPLPLAALETLALELEPVDVGAEEVVCRQGEPGDRFYIVDEGQLAVSVDGRPASKIGPGGYFGEVALLRDVPRTATVTASVDSRLLALGRDAFIAAATGHARSVESADVVIGAYRLGSLRSDLGAV